MKTKSFNQLEFWISTTLFIFTLINLISRSSFSTQIYYPNKNFLDEEHISYSVLSNYFFPQLFKTGVLYISFLLINFCFAPLLSRPNDRLLGIILILITSIASTITFGIANTYLDAYRLVQYNTIGDAYNTIFFESFIFIFFVHFCFTVYCVFFDKGIGMLQRIHFLKPYGPRLISEIFTIIRFWLIGFIILLVTLNFGSDNEPLIFWFVSPLLNAALVLYCIYYKIPQLRKNFKNFGLYFWGNVGYAIMISVVLLLVLAFTVNKHNIPVVLLFNAICLICISTPLAWYIYKHKYEQLSELELLKTELGKSDASLSFLRSQINPHFLFNALNTLYGTALQENAERTGEGIQKLGDMMRFMLQENHQDKISLARDVDYLNNYIELQKLRTSRSPDITIQTQIQEQLNSLEIAPMLLIPFVENAFKHGISLQEPSHIRVTLQTKENVLYFDVHNSIHIKKDDDPEKFKSGIGLQNVKQRLALLYPNRHELIIRENAREFFIHMTLQL